MLYHNRLPWQQNGTDKTALITALGAYNFFHIINIWNARYGAILDKKSVGEAQNHLKFSKM